MYQLMMDLPGEVYFQPNFSQTKARINYLIDESLSCVKLGDRPENLLQQFSNSQSHP